MHSAQAIHVSLEFIHLLHKYFYCALFNFCNSLTFFSFLPILLTHLTYPATINAGYAIIAVGYIEMEIDYIREFVTLADVGNYMEAADILFISQSTLSRHIKSIEEDLGAPLFDRTTRKVVINDFGKIFLPYAKQIMNLQYDYTTALFNHQNNISETITIGAIPVMAQYHITDVLADFQRENRNFKVHIIEADSSELKEMLRNEQCDFAFIREHDDSDNEFVKIPFTTDHMVAVLPSSHPLSSASSISLEQLKDENFLFLNKGTLMHTLCVNACKSAGFRPNIAFTGYRAGNIISLVRKEMGVALLTKKPAVYLAGPDISIVDVTPCFTTTISLAYSKKKELGNAAKHFINSVKARPKL